MEIKIDETLIDGRRSIVVQNSVARLVLDLLGGSFVNFHFLDQHLNPLVWNNAGATDVARQMSHFLCLDRWGWPSAAEASRGMPYHGEAGLVEWFVADTALLEDGKIRTSLKCELPIAGLEVRRTVLLAADQASFTVTEEVINRNAIGSILNMAQHPSIGPPFLDQNTLVDANAGQGFTLADVPQAHDSALQVRSWPQATRADGRAVSLRYLRDDHDPEVAAYVIDEDHGWVTASNPPLGLLIGYIWSSADYPWFIAWRRAEDGMPLARGLEFGTTGLDWPHGDLVKKGKLLGRPLFVHLDAGDILTKSFSCFLLRIDGCHTGVGAVRRNGEQLTISERIGQNTQERTIESIPELAVLKRGCDNSGDKRLE